ncbi:hypothetical protein TNIN_175001 [Trichonephila inaurata madagascariensis]|uniref:Uncharacterized protein n=1 Tax=Trichonephila inaurata madagascariensis TaxID=2747483 RepID=A0A8X6X970_9ARAC|nr:hypothetical protein TNIN_175001 [Trichonephila inaurata madagascariensis]
MKASSIFCPGEDSMRILLSGTFQIITEKNMPSFFRCPRRMFSASQYSVFPAACSQRDAPDYSSGRERSLCKMAVAICLENLLPGKAARSRQAVESLSTHVLVRLMSTSDPVQKSMLFGDLFRPSW